MHYYFKPVVKPSAAATSSDVVTVSTSEAPSTSTVPAPAPSTSTAPKLPPLSAGAALLHAVSSLNDDTPSQPVLTSKPRHAFGWTER